MECGADDVILVTKDMTPQQIAKMAEEKLGGMPDITIECTGAEPCIQVCFVYIDDIWGQPRLII